MDTSNEGTDSETLREAARAAAGQADIRAAVREITVEALSAGRLDGAHIKEVINAVMAGVTEGVEVKGGDAKRNLEQAWAGLDDALAKSAEAVRLAMQEARADLSSFAESDLRRAADELRGLEQLFLDTASRVASGAGKTTRQILEHLVEHAKRAGTDAGRHARPAASALQNLIEEAARQGLRLGINVTRQVARVASGVLAGIADSLDSAAKQPPKP